ncbi:MAG TPA: hypothetical protein VIJ97_05845 [Candidatus Anoxymicrobiaceae bacterium]
MSQEPEAQRPPRIKVYVEITELSSKQRGAALGLLKDMGFAPEEVSELVVTIPEALPETDGREGRRQKRK